MTVNIDPELVFLHSYLVLEYYLRRKRFGLLHIMAPNYGSLSWLGIKFINLYTKSQISNNIFRIELLSTFVPLLWLWTLWLWLCSLCLRSMRLIFSLRLCSFRFRFSLRLYFFLRLCLCGSACTDTWARNRNGAKLSLQIHF